MGLSGDEAYILARKYTDISITGDVPISKVEKNIITKKTDGLYAEVDTSIAEAIGKLTYLTKEVIDKTTLDAYIADPTKAKFNVIYLYRAKNTGTDMYQEYQRLGDETSSRFICTGDTSTDLANYVKNGDSSITLTDREGESVYVTPRSFSLREIKEDGSIEIKGNVDIPEPKNFSATLATLDDIADALNDGINSIVFDKDGTDESVGYTIGTDRVNNKTQFISNINTRDGDTQLILQIVKDGEFGASITLFNDLISLEGKSFEYNYNKVATQADLDAYLPLEGGAMTGPIKFKGSKSTTDMIKWIDNTTDAYGNGIELTGGGAIVIGSGESADKLVTQISSGGTEQTLIGSDGQVQIYTNCNGDITAAKKSIFNADGTLQLATSGSIVNGGVNAVTGGTVYDYITKNFQAGVDSIYNAIKAQGTTPTSKSLSDVVTSIETLSTDRYDAGVKATKKGNAGVGNVWGGYTFTNTSSVGASGSYWGFYLGAPSTIAVTANTSASSGYIWRASSAATVKSWAKGTTLASYTWASGYCINAVGKMTIVLTYSNIKGVPTGGSGQYVVRARHYVKSGSAYVPNKYNYMITNGSGTTVILYDDGFNVGTVKTVSSSTGLVVTIDLTNTTNWLMSDFEVFLR